MSSTPIQAPSSSRSAPHRNLKRDPHSDADVSRSIASMNSISTSRTRIKQHKNSKTAIENLTCLYAMLKHRTDRVIDKIQPNDIRVLNQKKVIVNFLTIPLLKEEIQRIKVEIEQNKVKTNIDVNIDDIPDESDIKEIKELTIEMERTDIKRNTLMKEIDDLTITNKKLKMENPTLSSSNMAKPIQSIAKMPIRNRNKENLINYNLMSNQDQGEELKTLIPPVSDEVKLTKMKNKVRSIQEQCLVLEQQISSLDKRIKIMIASGQASRNCSKRSYNSDGSSKSSARSLPPITPPDRVSPPILSAKAC